MTQTKLNQVLDSQWCRDFTVMQYNAGFSLSMGWGCFENYKNIKTTNLIL